MSEDLCLVELKAKAYDLIATIEGLQGQVRNYQNELRQVNDLVIAKTKEQTDESKS